MLRLLGIVISIGLADSVNPTTVAPALVLAAGKRAQENVARFTLGVFTVYLVGGLLIALGPGELILDLVPKPSHQTGQILEVIAGAMLLAVGAFLWRHRVALRSKALLASSRSSRSSWLLGATITAVELPTAFPYFGALAAIVGSGDALYKQVLLIIVFNGCFIAPLVAIFAVLTFAGEQAQSYLARLRTFLQQHGPLVLALVVLVAGAFTITLGVTGLVGRSHTDAGSVARKLHNLLPH
jgi:cytochrome c biogenesis protein CcdA